MSSSGVPLWLIKCRKPARPHFIATAGRQKLLLSTYVDDLTFAGPTIEHESFWAKLTSVVDIEPPEPIYRILGRNHLVMPLNQADGHEECAAFRVQKALIFDMLDYAHQTVDLFISASPTPRAWSMRQHHSYLMAPSQFSMKKLKASWPLMHVEYSWRCCGLADYLDPI